ncbi:hypothetical protein ACJ73_06863 [Blastomyces percursus]|uniref:Uncharacterized protein n=1 Tax=Blastomyces percursus TaxID=1658174 RepID=A0A1J9R2F0_9EURO|nr:hypothetical protein ACJ73_06863 [Blastomyces percursus]
MAGVYPGTSRTHSESSTQSSDNFRNNALTYYTISSQNRLNPQASSLLPRSAILAPARRFLITPTLGYRKRDKREQGPFS